MSNSSDVSDDVNLDDLPKFRLFFKNVECDECPMHLFDYKSDEWNATRISPRRGDHVVKDGTELLYLGSNQYEELDPDEEVWDFSEPEAAKIEKVEYRSPDYADRSSDPLIDPSNLIQLLRHF